MNIMREIIEKLVKGKFTKDELRRAAIIADNLKPDSVIHKDTVKVFLDKSFIDEP